LPFQGLNNMKTIKPIATKIIKIINFVFIVKK